MISILLCFLLVVRLQGQYNSSLYYLGDNLVTNGNFSSPSIPTGTAYELYMGNILGWSCNSECDVKNMPESCSASGVSCSINFTKGLDFDASNALHSISQNISIPTDGEYLFHVDWIPPFYLPIGKKFRIQINSTTLLNVTVSDFSYTTHSTELLVNLTAGNMLYIIGGYGTPPNGRGIIVGAITVQQLLPIPTAASTNITNTATSTTNETNTTANGTNTTTNLTNTTTNVTNTTTNVTNTTTNVTNTTTNVTNTTTSLDTANSTTPASTIWSDPTNNSSPPPSGPSNLDGSTSQSELDWISLIMLNDYTRFLNQMPGNRIFLSTLMNFLITFDRLQLYYFHHHQLSYYSNILLANINTLELEQGDLPQNFFQSCNDAYPICEIINNGYNNLLDALDRKQVYSGDFFLSRNSNGIGFFANNLDFFYYKVPVLFVGYLLLSLMFKVLFNYRLSRYFRKYSFYGIILLIIYEGNIEQFTFYFLEECKNFFSATLTHKLGNVFMTHFFFIALFFSVAGLIWFKFHYRKLVKYFTEEYKIMSLYLLVLETLQKSFFPLLFGFAHSLLIDNLPLQTIVLGIIEVSYFCSKLAFLQTWAVMFKFKVVVLSITSLLRMGLIVTLYLFFQEGGPALINRIHHDIVWLYLICWIVESLYDLIIFLADLLSVFPRGSKYPPSSKKHSPQVTKVDLNFFRKEMGKAVRKKVNFAAANIVGESNFLPGKIKVLKKKTYVPPLHRFNNSTVVLDVGGKTVKFNDLAELVLKEHSRHK